MPFGEGKFRGDEPENKRERGAGLTRGEFLKIAGSGIIALAAEQLVKRMYKRPSKVESKLPPLGEEEDPNIKIDKTEIEDKEREPVTYDTSELSGYKLVDLYTAYTGIRGVVGSTSKIDFEYQLQKLWERKNKRSENRGIVVETGKKLRKEYKETDKEPTDLDSYVKQIDVVIGDLQAELDFSQIQEIKGLSREKTQLVERMSKGINGKDLMAYALTELMPIADGELNSKFMNFLLKNAGSKFVESIPAIGDPKTSFGPYQFTEYALYRTQKETRGASIINQTLPVKKQIPDSVSRLRGSDHHKAAYMFMLDNLINLVKRANEKQFANLKAKKDKKEDLIAFLAAAHHMPRVAESAAIRWLSSKKKSPYENFFDHSDRRQMDCYTYAKKTKANLHGLYQ